MPWLHTLQRHALALVACAMACIAINAAHAEVASVYCGSDGRTLWKPDREWRACELFGDDCSAPDLALWLASDGLSPRMCCRAD